MRKSIGTCGYEIEIVWVEDGLDYEDGNNNIAIEDWTRDCQRCISWLTVCDTCKKWY